MNGVLERELILPSEDMMFKNIFGREENLHLLKDLLSSILKIPKENFKNITFINNEQNPNYFGGKKSICDVKVKLQTNETIIIEMQKESHKGFADRMLFYNSKAFTDSVNKSNKYERVYQTITILFVNFNFFNDDVEGHHDIFYIKSAKHDRIFSQKQVIHVIELNKIPRGIYPWYDFIKAENMEEMQMAIEKNPIINDAIDVVKYFNADETFRYNALRQRLLEMDEAYRMSDAEDRGMQRGVEKGIEQGVYQVAQNLIKMNLEISAIVEATGLSEKQVVDISKSMEI